MKKEMDFIQEEIILNALREDIGSGDITTDAVVSPGLKGKGSFIAKEAFVLAGIDTAKGTFSLIDSGAGFREFFKDGDKIPVGAVLLEVFSDLGTLLRCERTALNFLQHLSGIATNTRKFVKRMGKSHVRLVDTRKTTPGLRILEKYAVRMGGGFNHRFGLYDGVLIKDNHIAAAGGITEAVNRIRKKVHHLVRIEVEVEDIEGVKEALAAGVDIIMLDNMDLDEIRAAVVVVGGKALLEVSGGITEKKLDALAKTGVDIISSGALTHSAGNVDISMRIEPL